MTVSISFVLRMRRKCLFPPPSCPRWFWGVISGQFSLDGQLLRLHRPYKVDVSSLGGWRKMFIFILQKTGWSQPCFIDVCVAIYIGSCSLCVHEIVHRQTHTHACMHTHTHACTHAHTHTGKGTGWWISMTSINQEISCVPLDLLWEFWISG